MTYDNCSECPNFNNAGCPLNHRSISKRRQICPHLRLDPKGPDVNKMIDLRSNSDNAWRDKLRSILFPPMDYSRDDTGEIAKCFDPNLN